MPDGPDWEHLERTAKELVVETAQRGITLRLAGSLGVRLHCAPMTEALDDAKRAPKDIDLVCRRRDASRLRKHFESRGYLVDRDLLIAMEGHRYAFRHPEQDMEVDVFVDELDFCHTIDLRHRLDRHPLTISLEDLLLHKLQIVELTPGDRIDLHALFHVHDVGADQTDPETVDGEYISTLLGADWGFWRTATGNLEGLSKETTDGVVLAAIADLLKAIEDHRKTAKWKLRSRIGERMQWWQEVQERGATY